MNADPDPVRHADVSTEPSAEGRGVVVAVSSDDQHRFAKPRRRSVNLIAGWGVEGDAHAGPLVKHRYLARRDPQMPNLRQVHLIQAELYEDIRPGGFIVQPGELGENITTRGVDLVALPLGTCLRLGATAIVELTGVRTPCFHIDAFQKGLLRALVTKHPDGRVTYKSGVMGIVREGGGVAPGDAVQVLRPDPPWQVLPPL